MRARAGAAERKRAVRREAAFSLSVFTAALAIALLLSGAILKLACRANTQDRRRTAETWLQAFHQDEPRREDGSQIGSAHAGQFCLEEPAVRAG
jgi:hypothetical protein